MPPFITRECPYCNQDNIYDRANLESGSINLYRRIESPAKQREYIVTCQMCKREFVITVDPDSTAFQPGRTP